MSNPANFYEEVGAAPVSEKVDARFYQEVRLRRRHPRRGFVQVGVGLKLGRVLDAVLLQRAL